MHFFAPSLLALLFRGSPWWRNYLLLLSGLFIDLDHLLAEPVYDSLRCSMGFHPLHTWPALLLYVALCLPRRTRLAGLGLLLHLGLDTGDCLGMPGGLEQLSTFLPWAWDS